ncbi:hypothetical protein BpHYR1_025360 [Brachionus plicatilis]|uniref:Uncharacterized protein n=1 Tax=Brachionus plicatilis TaxID=10195 RepID=A0A3M7RRU9_BRAPC|nr:hypothetical protein BpHYR1_025360 [Brachionus plicatilis]
MSSTESVVPNFNEEDTMLDIDQEDVERQKRQTKKTKSSSPAVVEQEPPSDSVIAKEYVTEATVQATVETTVDLPRKRGRPKKSTTQGKKTKIN